MCLIGPAMPPLFSLSAASHVCVLVLCMLLFYAFRPVVIFTKGTLQLIERAL